MTYVLSRLIQIACLKRLPKNFVIQACVDRLPGNTLEICQVNMRIDC